MTQGGTSAGATRGFLFADLRGYTAFVERAGAHRAAVMLTRYRDLVRHAVSRFHGAEIRTEGDSFYVVFDRASAAIECGLAIVAAAAESSRSDPDLPISVGVGVHAGETVETAEGYVGGAVNIAARVCAVAGPNQVLVTDTVRALTTGVAPVEFAPFGRRRLKGLAQPIVLHRALPSGTVVPRRRLTTPAYAPMVAVGLIAIALVGIVAGVLLANGWLGARRAGPGLGASITASVESSVSTPPQASASPSRTAGPFPTEEESALLAILAPRPGDECRRMDPDDAPRHFFPDATGAVRPHDIDFVAGVDCSLGGVITPDQAWVWWLPPLRGTTSRVPTPNEVLSLQGSRIGAGPGGECALEIPALEDWSFGQHAGLLLCYQSNETGATLMWTYDDEPLIGKAIRFDRDMAALLDWWTDVARFGP